MGMTYIIAGNRLLSADFTFASHNIISLQGKISGIDGQPINYLFTIELKKSLPAIGKEKRFI